MHPTSTDRLTPAFGGAWRCNDTIAHCLHSTHNSLSCSEYEWRNAFNGIIYAMNAQGVATTQKPCDFADFQRWTILRRRWATVCRAQTKSKQQAVAVPASADHGQFE